MSSAIDRRQHYNVDYVTGVAAGDIIAITGSLMQNSLLLHMQLLLHETGHHVFTASIQYIYIQRCWRFNLKLTLVLSNAEAAKFGGQKHLQLLFPLQTTSLSEDPEEVILKHSYGSVYTVHVHVREQIANEEETRNLNALLYILNASVIARKVYSYICFCNVSPCVFLKQWRISNVSKYTEKC